MLVPSRRGQRSIDNTGSCLLTSVVLLGIVFQVSVCQNVAGASTSPTTTSESQRSSPSTNGRRTGGAVPTPNPVPAATAIVTAPSARFTVLSPWLIRLEHLVAPPEERRDHATMLRRSRDSVDVDVTGSNVDVTGNGNALTRLGDDRATAVVINRWSETHPCNFIARFTCSETE